jgi:hypothetical protein
MCWQSLSLLLPASWLLPTSCFLPTLCLLLKPTTCLPLAAWSLPAPSLLPAACLLPTLCAALGPLAVVPKSAQDVTISQDLCQQPHEHQSTSEGHNISVSMYQQHHSGRDIPEQQSSQEARTLRWGTTSPCLSRMTCGVSKPIQPGGSALTLCRPCQELPKGVEPEYVQDVQPPSVTPPPPLPCFPSRPRPLPIQSTWLGADTSQTTSTVAGVCIISMYSHTPCPHPPPPP